MSYCCFTIPYSTYYWDIIPCLMCWNDIIIKKILCHTPFHIILFLTKVLTCNICCYNFWWSVHMSNYWLLYVKTTSIYTMQLFEVNYIFLPFFQQMNMLNSLLYWKSQPFPRRFLAVYNLVKDLKINSNPGYDTIWYYRNFLLHQMVW